MSERIADLDYMANTL